MLYVKLLCVGIIGCMSNNQPWNVMQCGANIYMFPSIRSRLTKHETTEIAKALTQAADLMGNNVTANGLGNNGLGNDHMTSGNASSANAFGLVTGNGYSSGPNVGFPHFNPAAAGASAQALHGLMQQLPLAPLSLQQRGVSAQWGVPNYPFVNQAQSFTAQQQQQQQQQVSIRCFIHSFVHFTCI
jgi:hypothetical protein